MIIKKNKMKMLLIFKKYKKFDVSCFTPLRFINLECRRKKIRHGATKLTKIHRICLLNTTVLQCTLKTIL